MAFYIQKGRDVMAKRFTDSDKWKDQFFQDMGGKIQLFYLYLLDNCDHAGVWKINFKHFEFCTGFAVTKNEAEKALGDRIVFINEEIALLPKFLKFQYGEMSSLKSKVRAGVINRLKFHDLLTNPIVTLYIPLGNTIHSVQEKEYINISKAPEKSLEEKITNHDLVKINDEVFKVYEFNFGYPRNIFDEFARDAWPLYMASDDPRKSWKRFLTHYLKNSKPQIEDRLREMVSNKPYSKILSDIFKDEVASV